MPPVLTDEEMNAAPAAAPKAMPIASPRRNAAVSAPAPVLSDREMGIGGQTPLLNSVNRGNRGPSPLTDAQMDLPVLNTGGLSIQQPPGGRIPQPPILSDSQMGIPTGTPTMPIPSMPSIPSPSMPPMPNVPEQTIPDIDVDRLMPNVIARFQQTERRDPTPDEITRMRFHVSRSSPITPRQAAEMKALEERGSDSWITAAIQGATHAAAAPLGVFAPESLEQYRHDQAVENPVKDSLGTKIAGFAGAVVPATGALITGGPAALPVIATQAGLSGAGDTRVEASQLRDAGQEVSGADEAEAAIGRGLIDAVMTYLTGKAAKLAGNAPGGFLGRITAATAAGAATGGAAQFSKNVVTQQTIDPDKPLGEGVADAAISQGIAGGAFRVGDEAMTFLRNSPSLRNYFGTRAREARTPEEQAQVRQEAEDFASEARSRGQARQQSQQQRQQGQPRPKPAQWDEATAREELGLPRKGPITADQIRSAFRARVMHTHPDVGGDEAAVQRVVAANEFLRSRYAPPPPPEQPTAKPQPAQAQPQPTAQPQQPVQQPSARPQATATEPPPPVPTAAPPVRQPARPMTDAEMGVQPAEQASRKVIIPPPPVQAPVHSDTAADTAQSPIIAPGGSGEPPETPAPAADAMANAVTGRPLHARLMRGQGRSNSPYSEFVPQELALGFGHWTTPDRSYAEHFGPNVTEHDVDLRNPLVIRTDQEWRSITRSAGWKLPNPFGSDRKQVSADIARLRAQLEAAGHDGVVIDPSPNGDEARTLSKVFGSQQVIEFKAEQGNKKSAPGPAVRMSTPEAADATPKSAGRPAPLGRARSNTTRAAIELELQKEMSSAGLSDNPDTLENQGYEGMAPFVFHKKLPREITQLLQGRAHLRKLFKVTQDARMAGGADAFAELGEDRYLAAAESAAGGTNRKLIEMAIKTPPTPRAEFLAHVLRMTPPARVKEGGRYKANPELTQKNVIDPENLPIGATFELHGSKFEVIEDDNGIRVLKDGDDYPVVPAEAVGPIPTDKGSLEMPRSDSDESDLPDVDLDEPFPPEPAKASPSSDAGIFGQTIYRNAAGKQQGGLFHEPTQVAPVESERIGSKSAADPQNTGQMFAEPRAAEEQDAAARASRHHGAAYIGWLDPVVEMGKTVAGAAGEIGEGFINLAVRDLIERVAARGTPSAKLAASLATKAVNTAKAAAGQIATQRDKALVVTGAGLSPSRHKAMVSLQRVVYAPGKQYGIARIVDAVEGKIPAAQLSRAEREAVDVIRELTDVTGKGYRANGIQQFNYTQGQWQPFNYIPGGKVFVRMQTPEMMDVLQKGPASAAWNPVIDAIADLNPQMGRATVEQIMQQKHAEMIGEGPQGAFGRVNAEFTREVPKMPTHVLVGRDELPLIETNPFRYSQRLADHYAARVGFVRWFGQDTGPQSPLSMLRELYLKENGKADSLIQLTRALNGIAVEDPYVNPGGKLAMGLRPLRDAMTIAKAGLLSASAVQNIAEPLGNLQTFSGGADFFKAAWNLLRSPRATIMALERLGAVNMNPADLAWNPNRPTESIARIIREASGRIFGHQFVNELQEKMAGAIALEKVQRMQAGNGTSGDIIDLRALGFPLDKARRLKEGKGTPAEYNEVIRKMPPALVGSPLSGAEKTRLSHNRVYKAAIAFETYAQMKVRSFHRQAAAYADVAHKTRMGVDNPRLFFAAHIKMARYLAGTTAAGALAYFLMALATGGAMGLDIAMNEAKDRPLRFLRDSFLYTLLAGPYGAVTRMATGDRSLGDTLTRGTLPGFLLSEVIDAYKQTGSYQGMTVAEAMSHLAGRLLPVNKVATQAAAAMGFGEENAQMDTAIRAYWRWKMDDSPGKYTAAEVEGARAKFRASMRRAYSRMRAGDSDGMIEAMRDDSGAGVSDSQRSMNQSILGRRLLWNLPDEKLQALRDRIGERGMEQLQAHDNLLLAWASSLSTAQLTDTTKAVAAKDVRGAAVLNDEEMTSRVLRSEKSPERQDQILDSAGLDIPADVPLARELTSLRRMKREGKITRTDTGRLTRLESINRSIRGVRQAMERGTVKEDVGQRRIDSLLRLATTRPAA